MHNMSYAQHFQLKPKIKKKKIREIRSSQTPLINVECMCECVCVCESVRLWVCAHTLIALIRNQNKRSNLVSRFSLQATCEFQETC